MFHALPLILRLWNDARGKCLYCKGSTWIPRRQRRVRGVIIGETRVEAIIRLRIRASERATVNDLIKYSVATKEHLVRRADGGGGFGNYAMACSYCNSKRGDASVDEHMEAMAWRVMRGDHPVNRDPQLRVRTRVAADLSTGNSVSA